MWYCFHEQDIGIDNFEGQGKSGLIYVIYMKVKKKPSFECSHFERIAFHFFPQNNGKQWNTIPYKHLHERLKKAVQRFVMTFSSGHMPGILSLPCTVAFIATHWWYLDNLSFELYCYSDLWFLGDQPNYQLGKIATHCSLRMSATIKSN